MNDEQGQRRAPAWTLGRSIAMELDVMLGTTSGYHSPRELTGLYQEMAAGAPADWAAAWPEMLGEPREWVSVLTPLAVIAGVLTEESYSEATLPMRELTLADLLRWAEESAAAYGLPSSGLASDEARLVDAASRLEVCLAEELGLLPASHAGHTRRLIRDMAQMVRIVQGGDLHARFWHWLDRAYYEFYRPWRDRHTRRLEELERQAEQEFGNGDRAIGTLDLSHLPPQHPFHIHPGIRQAALSGRFFLFFWVHPFDLFDLLATFPGVMAVSFGGPSDALSRFGDRAAHVAGRVKALSDPTRLMIMRIIRHYGMDNTQMAAFLGLARPTVSIHAKILREAGLIESKSDGRAVVHTIDAREVRRLFRDIERFLELPEEDG